MKTLVVSDKLDWYQCDIIKKDGSKEFWCRFIADSPESARNKIKEQVKNITNNRVKNWFYRLLAKRYVKKFKVIKVSDDILKNYNFNKRGDTDKFYNRVMG